MDRLSFGQLLDEYLQAQTKENLVDAVFIYRDKNYKPHIVVTELVMGYEGIDEVFSTDHDLREDLEAKRKEIKQLQGRIGHLKRAEKEVKKAIKLLKVED